MAASPPYPPLTSVSAEVDEENDNYLDVVVVERVAGAVHVERYHIHRDQRGKPGKLQARRAPAGKPGETNQLHERVRKKVRIKYGEDGDD